ncbi:hypothetical protein [Chitinimonas sp. JJ19]|uniref:hypothetical protein n=1 Tax=Chitinimonas sp. JJ19 TaxID=3109352 RepID=UPI00300162FB
MNPVLSRRLCVAVVLSVLLIMGWHGPIGQPADYHQFADTRAWLSLPHAADVLSNLGFLVVGLGGIGHILGRETRLQRGDLGYGLFFLSLMLTAAGSAWYHLSPDNTRLVWDRLPIALACAGLLGAVFCRCYEQFKEWAVMGGLVVAAVFSVAWWRWTDLQGQGDLRPYLLLQLLPLVLIPLLQAGSGTDRRERQGFALAIACYVIAKGCELADHAILDSLVVVSGHTLKHVFATAAATVLAWAYASTHCEGS